MPFSDDTLTGISTGLQSTLKTLARDNYPQNMREVMDWARDLCLNNDTYVHGVQTGVRYFMTDIDVLSDDMDYKQRESFKDELSQGGRLLSTLADIGDETIFFGNSFTSAVPRLTRHLVCRKCGASHRMSYMRGLYKYDRERKFHGKCPACEHTGQFLVRDWRVSDEDMVLHIIRWPLEAMRIKYNPTSDHREYMLDTDIWPEMLSKIEDQDPFHLETTPLAVIDAAAKRKPMKFRQNGVFHMRTETVSEIAKDLGGWGFPRFLNSFSTVVMLLLLEKYNEVLLADYKVPMRVFSPPDSARLSQATGLSPGGSQLGQMTGSQFTEAVSAMTAEHRRNPGGHYTMPYPFQYQTLGGEASQLTDVQLLQFYENRLLRNMAIPHEVFAGSLKESTAPAVALRLFERVWQGFLHGADRWLSWYASVHCRMKQISPVDIRLRPVSVQEDPMVQQTLLELGMNKQISMGQALKPLNVDYLGAVRDMLDEEVEVEKMRADQSRKLEEIGTNSMAMHDPSPGEKVLRKEEEEMMAAEQQAAAQGGQSAPAPAPGGAGGAGGPVASPGTAGGRSESLSALVQEAEQLAQDLFGAPDRASRLRELDKHNPDLHAFVTKKLDKMENDVAQQGIVQARQQQRGA